MKQWQYAVINITISIMLYCCHTPSYHLFCISNLILCANIKYLAAQVKKKITVDFTCGFILETENVRSGPVHCNLGCIVNLFGCIQN